MMALNRDGYTGLMEDCRKPFNGRPHKVYCSATCPRQGERSTPSCRRPGRCKESGGCAVSVVVEYGTINVEDSGLAFGLSYPAGDVEIEIEFPDYGAWTSGKTATRYVTISREDWEHIVAYVAATDKDGRDA